jgi:omega-hydroxy-beta-dihydromenaquinone-9 sulfotransferase
MPFDSSTLIEALKVLLRKENFSCRYAFFVFISIAMLLFMRVLAQIGRLLDKLFFSGYRFQKVEAPIYIIANPRSGTTFLHRLLCLDEQFTFFKLYHTLLPSITLLKLIELLQRLDGRLCGTLARLANKLNQAGFKGWKGIHEARLTEAEEDEQLFLYTLLSPSFFMFFPFLEDLSQCAFVDRLPHTTRLKLMTYYRDCLQRHIYATGPGKTLLAKNVLIHGRLQSIIQTLPDMRIIYLVRHPYRSIPSFISMYAAFWRLYSPTSAADSKACIDLAELLCDYYNSFLEIKRGLPAEQLVELGYDELLADHEGAVRQIYKKYNLKMSKPFEKALKAETAKSKNYSSTHKYSLDDFGVSKELIRARLGDFMREYGFEE